MTKHTHLIAASLALIGPLCSGCGESIPENTPPTNGTNAHVSGSPEERIKSVEGNSALTPEEKAQRISAIKERNNIK